MAIQLSHTAAMFGATFPAAYWRVASADVRRQQSGAVKHLVEMQLEIYADATASLTAIRSVGNTMMSAPLSDVMSQPAVDFVGKCYQWLVAQPELAGGLAV